ncbi:uncharacterized protein Z520_02535 [Fonsecaea multimorphosa CBS 102226]|uniref:Uncharacterized protein n=1 Tax=Fonsecaea multimorphosa CBS 102226 TaxID=1442371 RepID=A0A0D2IZD0_9EURO|nr:uncharacterized protein Z520_02535 [Fonsecaea multimorphosa CBS 102226]KIY02397.1 hypothetical protein Z520_02535 [Fonsecaea multimorphosa CBS 102226]OAL29038.1 hypothetical protein AYO22_02474 [Fonsecaea multimorphosa]
MSALRQKAKVFLGGISSSSAPAAGRSKTGREVNDKAQANEGKAAIMATPSAIAATQAANVAFFPTQRTAPVTSSALEKQSVRVTTAPQIVPDHDPSASQASESRGSAMPIAAEADRFGDGDSVSQIGTDIHELDTEPSSTKMPERRVGLLRSRFSSKHARSAAAAPTELPAEPLKASQRQTGMPELDATGGVIHSQADGQTGTVASRSNKAVDDELYRVDKEIRKAAKGMVDESELDAAFKKRGTSGAFTRLIEAYEPVLEAEKELNNLEDKVREATKGHVQTMEVNAEIRERGPAGGLQLLLDHCQSALKAEQALRRVEDKIRSANHDVRSADLVHAQKTGGAEAMLALVVEDYQVKKSASLILERVAKQIKNASPQTARKEVDAALRSRGAGVESALALLVAAYQPYADAHKELTAIEGELKRVAREMAWTLDVDLILKRSGPEGALRVLIEHLQAKTESLRKLEARYSGLEQSWKKLTGENHALKQEQSQHQANIDDLNANHRFRMANLDETWKDSLEKQQKDVASQAQIADQRHRSEMESREASHRNEIATWRAAMQSVKEKHEIEYKELKTAKENLAQEYNAKVNRIREEFEAREKEARKREMERIEQLRLEAEDLKGELVRRDHFKGLSDPEICNRFTKLAQEVSSFSRVQWEKKKETRWPMQENALRRTENPRKLKQQIVQSTIWMILKERIFHSPFALLGDEGQRIHREWTSEYGEDPSSELPRWPEATEDSESWRFDRIKEYWDASSKKTDSGASRRLKPPYDQSIAAAVDDIRNTVETISTLSPHDLQLIRDFVELAATFWLDVSSLKCRVYLVFPAQGVKALVHRKPATATADLVIQPEVRRRGNAQGQRFVKEQVVTGCEGERTRF